MKYLFINLFIGLSFICNSQFNDKVNNKKYKTVHALLIGVSNYHHVPQLNYADKDAEVMYQLLSKSYPEDITNIHKLTNDGATEYSITSAVDKLKNRVKEGDLVIFYFSGHGDVVYNTDSTETHGYFLTSKASDNRVYDMGGAIRFEYINEALSDLSESNKAEVWLFTDACKAGKIINKSGANNTTTVLNNGFKDITKFVSSSSRQLSYEDSTIQQGVFTYYLVKALAGEADDDDHEGVLNVDEIDGYLKKSVRTFTQKKQTPKVIADDEFKDIIEVNPSFLSLIASGKDIVRLMQIEKGAKGEEPNSTPKITKLENLIADGFLHGKTGYALEFYLSETKTSKNIEELDAMKQLVIEALMERGNRFTNLFLSGRPMVNKNENFSVAMLDYKLTLDLLGPNHSLSELLNDRVTFYTAMLSIQNNENLEKAEKDLVSLSLKNPKAAYINQGLAMLYVKKADKLKAEEQLELAEIKNETWTKPKNTSAYLNIIAGKLDVAESFITKSEKQGKSNQSDNINLLKAQLGLANYELQNAEKSIQEIKNLNNQVNESEVIAYEAKINQLRGRISVAIEQYKNALNKDVTNIDVLINLGDLYSSKKDTAKAINYYEKILKIEPNNQIALANIASLKNKQISIDPIAVDPLNLHDVLYASKILESKKMYAKAIELLDRSLQSIKWNPELYYELGRVKYSKGDIYGSKEALKKALELSPYHFKSIHALAYILLGEKKHREIHELISKHDSFFRESAQWLTFQYQINRYMGSTRDLFTILEKAKSLDRLETQSYRGLYKLYIDNNAFKEAKGEFEDLIHVGNDERDSLLFFNYLSNQIQKEVSEHKYMDLEDGLEILLEQDPFNIDYSFYLSMTLYMKKEYENANLQLRKISKFMQASSPGVQRQFYTLRGKIYLEMGEYELAEKAFKLVLSSSGEPKFLGLAMAQFMLKKDSWKQHFMKDQDLTDFNEDAYLRFEKMKKKLGK